MEILRCCALGAEIFSYLFWRIGFHFLRITYWIAFLQVLRSFLFIFSVACETMLGPKVVGGNAACHVHSAD